LALRLNYENVSKAEKIFNALGQSGR
jgi:hypothetical protein